MRVLTATLLLLVASTVQAEDAKLSGTWAKSADGFDLKIAFVSKDALKVTLGDTNEGCVLDASYTVEKDGTVKCEVTKFEKIGNFPVTKEKGYKFSFKTTITGDKAKITDFEGKDIDDEAKRVFEGEYVKK